jgi:hypothetical protein
MEEDVSLINAWGWVRYRDRRMEYLDGSVEIQDSMDLLVSDLGLKAMRKKEMQRRKGQVFGLRGWAKEWYVQGAMVILYQLLIVFNRFWPYKGSDYNGLVAEYMKRWGLNEVEGPKKGLEKRDVGTVLGRQPG